MKNREISAEYTKHLPPRKRCLQRLRSIQQQPNCEASSFSCAQPRNDPLASTPPPSHPLVPPDPQALQSPAIGAIAPVIVKREKQQQQQQQEEEQNGRSALPIASPETAPSHMAMQNGEIGIAKKKKSLRDEEEEEVGKHQPSPTTMRALRTKQDSPLDEESSGDDKEDDGKIYCVCKTTYNPNLWMICCDTCNEWYHGKCVQVTANEARKIKVYVCPVCKEKNPMLQIEYKVSKKKQRSLEENSNNGNSNGTANSANNRSPPNTNGGVESSSSSPGELPYGVLSPHMTPSNIARLASKKRKKMVIGDDDSNQETEPSKRPRNHGCNESNVNLQRHAILSLVEPLQQQWQQLPPQQSPEQPQDKECTIPPPPPLSEKQRSVSPSQVVLDSKSNYTPSQSSKGSGQLYHKLLQQEVPANY